MTLDSNFYHIPGVGSYPRVSTILSSTDSTKDRAALQKWSEKTENQEKARLARERGTKVHWCLEQYILNNVVPCIDDDISAFVDPALKIYDTLKDQGATPVWVEQPVGKEKRELWAHSIYHYQDENGVDQEGGVIWSNRGYAGRPDQIFQLANGNYVLVDVKTSTSPYRTSKPSAPPKYLYSLSQVQAITTELIEKNPDLHRLIISNAADSGKTDADIFEEVREWLGKKRGRIEDIVALVKKGGESTQHKQAIRELSNFREASSKYRSYCKARLQLIAYREAIKDTLKIDISEMWIVNATNDGKKGVYFYRLKDSDIPRVQQEWDERLALYYSKNPERSAPIEIPPIGVEAENPSVSNV